MPVKIENITSRPVLLRLNSGQTLHLAPRKTSEEIREVEVSNNAKVQKLQERHVIALRKAPKPKKRAGRRAKSSPQKEK
ncbi:MAG: hypothetical protein GY803_30005 [Chloroflexi bacterium]|nr:hypothetical protein [Chloroflexota bacterium]